MRRVVIGIFAGVVALVILVVLCTFVKRPYEQVLLNRFGRLIEEKEQSRIAYNWYFKLPTDSVVRFDRRLHLYTSPLQEVTTAGKEPISIRTFAAWRIVDPMKFYKATGGSDEKAESTMEQILRGLVPGKIVNHHLDELFNAEETKVHIAQIEADVAKEATLGTDKTPGLQDMGIQIAEIGFSRMAFPPSNAASVYDRMVADLNKRAIEYQSQGLSEANRIRAEGDAAAKTERAVAMQEAQKIRGEADAAALRVLADVQATPQAREFYQYWKSLEFLKTSLSKNTILVLSANSPILQSIFGIDQRPGRPPLPTPASDAVRDLGIITIPVPQTQPR